jgi:CBS domain-containing protein
MSRRIEDRPVREIMTASPVTVSPATTLADLRALFETLDFNAFPVTDTSGVLRGVVTKLDLLRILAPARFRWIPDLQLPWAGRIDDIMTRDVITVGPDDTVAAAIDRMIAYGVRSLPVVERRQGRPMLVGIVSRRDVLSCLDLDGTEAA